MINLSTSKKGIDNKKPWGFDQIQKKRFLSKFNNKYNHGNKLNNLFFKYI